MFSVASIAFGTGETHGKLYYIIIIIIIMASLCGDGRLLFHPTISHYCKIRNGGQL